MKSTSEVAFEERSLSLTCRDIKVPAGGIYSTLANQAAHDGLGDRGLSQCPPQPIGKLLSMFPLAQRDCVVTPCVLSKREANAVCSGNTGQSTGWCVNSKHGEAAGIGDSMLHAPVVHAALTAMESIVRGPLLVNDLTHASGLGQ
eukprot:scaffold4109_cov133-Isochrysis_galbana.AAC.4